MHGKSGTRKNKHGGKMKGHGHKMPGQKMSGEKAMGYMGGGIVKKVVKARGGRSDRGRNFTVLSDG